MRIVKRCVLCAGVLEAWVDYCARERVEGMVREVALALKPAGIAGFVMC